MYPALSLTSPGPTVHHSNGERQNLGHEPESIRLEPGDTAVLFTDGITEARNGAGEEYSEQRLRAMVAGRPELSASELCRAVLDEAHGFACATEPCDDVTLVVVKRKRDRAV